MTLTPRGHYIRKLKQTHTHTSIMTLDHDENNWIQRLVKRKAQDDTHWMSSMFLKHYCKLMDSTIRKHWFDMCYKCVGTEGTHYHICEDDTASLVIAFGGSVLDYATDDEKMKTWREFLDDVYDYGVFKKVIVKWLKNFKGAKAKIDEDRDIYWEFMRRHFPNPTQDPHQVYLDYPDYDQTD